MTAQGLTIVYDGDCPFCSAYVAMLRLRDAAGPVTLLDARTPDHPLIARIHAEGLDLDDGMAVDYAGRLWHGDAAMTLLASLTTPSGPFNRASAWAFRSPLRARLLYPPLRAGRNLTLRLLGRRKIAP